MTWHIAVSGWHSGPNPSPGPGIARSISSVWPNVKILAVDYSERSTGLEDPIISARRILPGWKDTKPNLVAEYILSMVSGGDNVYISGLDLETVILADAGAGSKRNVLVPPAPALTYIAKPSHEAALSLGIKSPATQTYDDVRSAVSFCEQHGWPIWVKGPNYEAIRAWHPSGLKRAVDYISSTWSGDVLLQQDISGTEESIAFAAYNGRLLGCCRMLKTNVTADGKTWGGRIEELDPASVGRLSQMLEALQWTGGGEIEMVCERSTSSRYLIDFNPRFPAWIHGSTLSGKNLPAALVSAHTGFEVPRVLTRVSEFARIVVELPVQFTRPGVTLTNSSLTETSAKGHPSGMPELSRLRTPTRRSPQLSRVEDAELLAELARTEAMWGANTTGPTRILLPEHLNHRLRELRAVGTLIAERHGVLVDVAYSIKTNPSRRYLRAALRAGLSVEAISLRELVAARDSGFIGRQMTLNGPGKWWPDALTADLDEPARINCDSISDLDETLRIVERREWSHCAIGIRLSPLGHFSRFGVRMDEPLQFIQICDALSRLRSSTRGVGIHFHYAASAIGHVSWRREVLSAAAFVRQISDVVGCEFTYFDLGGGWRKSGVDEYRREISNVVGELKLCLPSLTSFVLEPGKIAVEDSAVLLSRVLATRASGRRIDAVVSAAVSDMPDAGSYPHEVLWKSARSSDWKTLPTGEDRILGRICMEDDILRDSVNLPSTVTRGDLLAFAGVGAYDSSMAYSFGAGDLNGE